MAFNNEDILVLAKAGFTAQQIAALSQVGSAAPTVDTTVPTAPTGSLAATAPAVQAQQPTTAPAPTAPAPAPTAPAPTAPAPATSAPHSVDDVLAAISGLTTTIQSQNLLNAQMPQEQKTAETILASIINPPKKKEE